MQDNGVGIPAELLPVVFEPFTQGEQALDRSQGGLGIGLTLVQRLVKLHGGSVGAYSTGSGQGSEFVVRLPVLRVEAVRRSSVAEGEPAAGGGPGRRVLLVDDNVDSVTSLAVLLRLAGHEVALAHEGASALEAAQSFRPEVVLLDIGLPGMSGHEVARRLRERTGPARPLLVAMTGYGHEEDLRRSRRRGLITTSSSRWTFPTSWNCWRPTGAPTRGRTGRRCAPATARRGRHASPPRRFGPRCFFCPVGGEIPGSPGLSPVTSFSFLSKRAGPASLRPSPIISPCSREARGAAVIAGTSGKIFLDAPAVPADIGSTNSGSALRESAATARGSFPGVVRSRPPRG